MNWREEVVKEALTWENTPYHHLADIKGAGVDCAMLLVRVYCDLGLAPAFDPRPYSTQWFMHRDEERYKEWMNRYAMQVEQAQPGDIVLYRFGRCAAHGAIIIDDNLMLHAYRPIGKVMLQERRAPLPRGTIDSFWAVNGAI